MSHETSLRRSCAGTVSAQRSVLLGLGLLLLALPCAEEAGAQLEPLGEARVFDFGNQPFFAVEPQGAFGLVWVGRVTLSFPGMMFDASGETTSGRFRVRDELPDRETTPGALAVDGSGNYLVAWESHHISGADGRLHARFLDDEGQDRSPQFELEGSSPQVHFQLLDAASNRLGDSVVLWIRFDSRGPTLLRAARFDSRLRPAGGTITVRTGRVEPEVNLFGGTVTIDDAGHFVVTWQEWNEEERRLCFRRFDRQGNKLGGVRGGVRVIRRLPPGFSHLVAAKEPSGEFAVGWAHDQRIRLRFYDAFGRSLANTVAVGREDALGFGLEVARDRFGNTVVLWSAEDAQPPTLRARVYDRLGQPLGDVLEIGAGYSFAAQFTDDGTLVVSWVEPNGPHAMLAFRRFVMTCGPGYEQRCDQEARLISTR